MGHEQYSTKELTDITVDLCNYIKKNSPEVKNTTQFSIVLQKKLNYLHQKGKDVIFDNEISKDKKISVFSELLPYLNEVITKFPRNKKINNLWLDLTITTNFFMLNIASLGRQDDEWRIHASANILSDLLVGKSRIDHFEAIPKPDRKKNGYSPQQMKKLKRIRNAIVMTSGVYLESIITIYDLDYEKMIEWSREAFWHFQRYKQFLEDHPLEIIISPERENRGNIFEDARFFLMPLWNSLVFVINMTKVFGHTWPSEVETYGYVPNGIDGVIQLAEEIADTFSHYTDLMRRYYDEGRLSKNDNPKDSEHIIRLDTLSKFASLYSQHGELLRESNKIDHEKNQQLLDRGMEIKNILDELYDETEKPFESVYFAFYDDLYNLSIGYIYRSEDNELQKWITNLLTQSRDKVPHLYFKNFKLRLHYYGVDHTDFNNIIPFLKNEFEFRYRELIDIWVIEIIINIIQDAGGINLLIQRFKDKIESVGVHKSIKEKLYQYLDYLLNLDTPFPFEENEYNAFDYHSWTEILSKHHQIKYFPFSLENNKIF